MPTPPPFINPLTLGDLLDRAFRLYRTRFAALALTAALFLIPYGIFSGLITGRATANYFDFLQMLMAEPESELASFSFETFAPAGNFVGAIMLVGLVGLVVQAVVNLALLSQSDAALHEQPISWQVGLQRGIRRFMPYVGMSLLKYFSIGLVGIVGYFLVVCAMFAVLLGGGGLFGSFFEGGDFTSSDVVAMAGLGVLFFCMGILGILALFSPVFYLMARWLVTLPGLVIEEWGPVDALSGSWALTQGHVRRCLLYGFLLYLLNLIVVAVPASIVQQIVIAMAPEEQINVAMGASAGLGSLFTVLWQPLSIAAITLLYYDLRTRRGDYAPAPAVDAVESNDTMAANTPDDANALGNDRNEPDFLL